MAIYLIKDQRENQARLDLVRFDEREIEDAKHILEEDPRFHRNRHGDYHDPNKRYVQFADEQRIQIDDGLISESIIDRLVGALQPKYYMDDFRRKHPISELSKVAPSD